MRIWPWNVIRRLRDEVQSEQQRNGVLTYANDHYRRVLESIPEEVAIAGQKKVEAWYRERARQERHSVWN